MKLSTMISKNWALALATGALASAGLGCGSSATSSELTDARKAYDDAVDSPAAKYRPGELTQAREALDRAEDAHQADPGSKREARLATIAERRADNAKADGQAAARERAASNAASAEAKREVRSEQREERAEQPVAQPAEIAHANDEMQARQAARAEAKSEVRAERAAANRATLAKSGDQVADDSYADHPASKLMETREAAGQTRSPRATAALQGLSQVATVKEESRGVVITMSGALLFPSGKSELTPIARQNLDRVADAIAQQSNDTQVHVDGFTDAQGGEQQNKRLSQKRAQAVAGHLIARGVDKKRVTLAGRGEADPVADNESAEGRANNRRVEIVLATSEQAQQ